MSSGTRFYLPSYRNKPSREVYLEDLGNILTISGLVLQGMGSTLILMSPNLDIPDIHEIAIKQPTLEEWGEIIRQSDNPEIFVGDAGGINKVLHRKQRFTISGEVQQKVWARDGFKCMYCGVPMGKALMTIDHFQPLELNGVDNDKNYVTACRKDNKQKGMMMPEEFCKLKRYDYKRLKSYMDNLE